MPRQLAAELSRVLLAVDSYSPGYKLCGFRPGIALRFWKATTAADAVLCFDCNELEFRSANGRVLGSKMPFDPSREQLARLVRESRASDERFRNLRPAEGSREFDEMVRKYRSPGAKP